MGLSRHEEGDQAVVDILSVVEDGAGDTSGVGSFRGKWNAERRGRGRMNRCTMLLLKRKRAVVRIDLML